MYSYITHDITLILFINPLSLTGTVNKGKDRIAIVIHRQGMACTQWYMYGVIGNSLLFNLFVIRARVWGSRGWGWTPHSMEGFRTDTGRDPSRLA